MPKKRQNIYYIFGLDNPQNWAYCAAKLLIVLQAEKNTPVGWEARAHAPLSQPTKRQERSGRHA